MSPISLSLYLTECNKLNTVQRSKTFSPNDFLLTLETEFCLSREPRSTIPSWSCFTWAVMWFFFWNQRRPPEISTLAFLVANSDWKLDNKDRRWALFLCLSSCRLDYIKLQHFPHQFLRHHQGCQKKKRAVKRRILFSCSPNYGTEFSRGRRKK